MIELEAFGMERLPPHDREQAVSAAPRTERESSQRPNTTAVHGIPENGVAFEGQMHANLMRSTGLQC
jgi:hypothetical protein